MRLWILALLLAPSLVHAQQWGTTCDDNPATEVTWIGGASGKDAACFNFETEGTGNSNPIIVDAFSAIFCLDPAQDTDGEDLAQAFIRRCLGGATANSNTCIRILDSALTGLEGASGTQNACIRVGAGKYLVEVTTAGGAGDQPHVSVETEP